MKKISIIALFTILKIYSFAQINVINEMIFFSIGKTALTPQHKQKLDEVITNIKKAESYNVEIRGYTCNIGSLSINNAVSKFRALNVYNYMIDKGLQKNLIKYKGMAMENPIADNNTAEGRAKNRRTEIEVLYKLLDEGTGTSAETGIGTNNGGNSGRVGSNNSGASNTGSNTGSNSNLSNQNNKQPSKVVNLGPELSNGSFTNEGLKIIRSSNCIEMEVPEYSFSTPSKEPFEFELKDYTQNYDVIKKNIQTSSGGKPMMLLGAYTLNFTQGNEDITLNVNNPVKVYIPGKYDSEIGLYTNHKNWTKDSINKLSYDQAKGSYVIETRYLGQMFGLLKPMPDSSRNVLVKLTGMDVDKMRPYIIFEDHLIASGKQVKGSLFSFPIPNENASFRIIGAYTDFASKTPSNFLLNETINKLEPKNTQIKNLNKENFMRICTPAKFEYKQELMDKSVIAEPICK